MMITYFSLSKPKDINQTLYYNKFKFYINVIKTLFNFNINYIITTPKYIIEHNKHNKFSIEKRKEYYK